MNKKILLLLSLFLVSISIYSCTNEVKKVETVSSSDSTKQEKVLILDVRTVDEWNNDGHSDCATNIPLDQLVANLDTLKAYDKVVIVCRSGNRAGKAKDLLEEKGFANVENAGAWQNIECK
jgi:rhodanese-related sulfurtransferase